MDSMRSLNTSLPGTSPSKSSEPPEQLLTAFKAAALSVTQLYKTAAADQGRSRAEGYEDALYELLSFLDNEDIGLSDGEGWRIRRWATERLDGRDSVPVHTDSDEESTSKQERASSPEIHRSHSAPRISSTMRPTDVAATSAQTDLPSPTTTPPAPPEPVVLNPPAFTFRAGNPFTQDSEGNHHDIDMSDNSRGQGDGPGMSHASTPPITVTRTPRTSSRHNNHSGRSINRSGTSLSRSSTGQKRKITHDYGEFFNILNPEGKDGFSGGGKRGRFV
ncbi:hypothetical protein B0O99DRAFT_517030 [Bisporella sp. PMI_857]|nr:hypothetical protein B0O99DRAFT_517030 [Bisporella sp. PMI_857]